MITRWVVGVGLLFGILLLMLPNRDPESLSKIASASMLKCTADARKRVEQQVMRNEAVVAVFKNVCPDLIAHMEIGERGEMVITGNKYKLQMTLMPILEGGAVRWSCRGDPAAAVTKLCKP